MTSQYTWIQNFQQVLAHPGIGTARGMSSSSSLTRRAFGGRTPKPLSPKPSSHLGKSEIPPPGPLRCSPWALPTPPAPPALCVVTHSPTTLSSLPCSVSVPPPLSRGCLLTAQFLCILWRFLQNRASTCALTKDLFLSQDPDFPWAPWGRHLSSSALPSGEPSPAG